MARALRIKFPGAFSHITSRGNEKKDVFSRCKDRERFLFYIEYAAEVECGALTPYLLTYLLGCHRNRAALAVT